MNKEDLVNAIVAGNPSLSKKATGEVLGSTLEAIGGALAKGESVQLIGFGTFEVRAKAARTGRNPRTGEALKIAASKTVAFKVGKALKEKVA